MTTPNQTYAQAITGTTATTTTTELQTVLPSIPRQWSDETAKRIEKLLTAIYTDLGNLKTRIDSVEAQI